MTATNYPHVVCLLLGGPDRTIVIDGKRWNFEMHPRFGPGPQRKDREPRLTPWPAKVWDSVQLWIDQGQRLGSEGICIWEPAPDPLEGWRHIGGRNYVREDTP